MQKSDVILKIFGAPSLGHGRAWESFIILVALSYGISILLNSDAGFDSQATRDLAWMGFGRYISIPLILKGTISGYGLIANIRGFPYSQQARFLGALLGSFIWVWFVAKFAIIDQPFTLGSFFAFWAFIYSIRIMAMAGANRPIPGMPGAL